MHYILIHNRDNRVITTDSFTAAQRAYYYQERGRNGNIPWKIIHGEYLVDPRSGSIIGYAEEW